MCSESVGFTNTYISKTKLFVCFKKVYWGDAGRETSNRICWYTSRRGLPEGIQEHIQCKPQYVPFFVAENSKEATSKRIAEDKQNKTEVKNKELCLCGPYLRILSREVKSGRETEGKLGHSIELWSFLMN